MFTSVLSGKVLFVFPIFVSFSIMVVSLPSITSANSVAVSVLFGNWGFVHELVSYWSHSLVPTQQIRRPILL